MSQVYGAGLISGAQTYGSGGLGILGSVIRATTATGPHGAGYLYNDWDDASDDPKEFRGLITVEPSAGTFLAYEDGSFTLTGAPDGSYSFTYQLYVDGVATGSPQVDTITIGSGGVTGTSAVTLSAYTQTAAGAVAVSGASSVSLQPYTQTAAGAVQVRGASSVALSAYSQAATGLVTSGVTGNSSVTLTSYSQSAAGTVTGVGTVTGSSSVQLSAYSQAAAGSVTGLGTILGSSSVALSAYLQTATGEVTGTGTGVITPTPPDRRQSVSSDLRRQSVRAEVRRQSVTKH
jgi:hypothetical protein